MLRISLLTTAMSLIAFVGAVMVTGYVLADRRPHTTCMMFFEPPDDTFDNGF